MCTRGGRIIHAVDFSEIHAYAYPAQCDNVKLFSDDDTIQVQVTNDYILDKVFFGLKEPWIILSPYLVEVEAFAASLRRDSVDEASSEIRKFLNELHRTDYEKKAKEISTIITALTPSSREPNQKETAIIINFVKQYGGALQLLVRNRGVTVLQRLRYLLRNSEFSDLLEHARKYNISPETIGPHAETTERWYDSLSRIRAGRQSQTANYVDALAMGYLRAINDLLHNNNVIFKLITRSKVMHALYESEVEGGMWPDLRTSILKHPRSFMAVHPAIGNCNQGTLESLLSRRDNLSEFIRLADDLLGKEVSSKLDDEAYFGDFRRKMMEIKEEWHGMSQLQSASNILKDDISIKDSSYSSVRDALTLAHMLVEKRNIRAAITEAVNRLEDDIVLGHADLSFMMIKHEHLDKEFMQGNIRFGIKEHADKSNNSLRRAVTLSTNNLSTYFTIQFYAEEILNAKEEKQPDFKVINKFLGRQGGSIYERRLAMAYLLSLFHVWGGAETFCGISLNEKVSPWNIPRHEGHFYLSVCKRMHRPSVQRHWEALGHLEEASRLKAGYRGLGYEDPRYLKERAFHIFRLNELKDRDPRVNAPDVEEAVQLCERALALIRNDLYLRLQIQNNLCYFFLGQAGDKAKDKSKAYHDELTLGLRMLHQKGEKLPPQMLHTNIWARWSLSGGFTDVTEKQAMANTLKERMRDGDVQEEYRSIIREHVETIIGGEHPMRGT